MRIRSSANTHIQSASLPRYEATLYQKPLWGLLRSRQSRFDNVDFWWLPPPPWPRPRLPRRWPSNRRFILSVSGRFFLPPTGPQKIFIRVLTSMTRLRSGVAGTFSEAINISRNWSFSPTLTPTLNWQDKYDPFPLPTVMTSTTPVVIPVGIFRGYQGHLATSDNLRYRASPDLTFDQTYNLSLRLSPNDLTLDRGPQDGGIETNHMNWQMTWRLFPSRRFGAPCPVTICGKLRMKIWMPIRRSGVLILGPMSSPFSHNIQTGTISFGSRWDTNSTEEVLWEADAHARFNHKTTYGTGVSYNRTAPGIVTWNNTIGYYFSPGWRVDTTLNTLVPGQSLETIKTSTLLQTQVVVTRDLHCWNVQFTYIDLPPFTREYSLLFNLKLGAQAAKDITDPELESQFYPWRDESRR